MYLYRISILFLLLSTPGILMAQLANIQGKIFDENNQPIAGANVFLNGTVLGASSDDDGKFRISNVPGSRKTSGFDQELDNFWSKLKKMFS